MRWHRLDVMREAGVKNRDAKYRSATEMKGNEKKCPVVAKRSTDMPRICVPMKREEELRRGMELLGIAKMRQATE